MINGTPVKAFIDQDHEAHIEVHMHLEMTLNVDRW